MHGIEGVNTLSDTNLNVFFGCAYEYGFQLATDVARLFNSPCGLKQVPDVGFVVRRSDKFVPKKGIRGCALFRIANQHSV